MERKVYLKPAIQVEEFAASHYCAEGCNRETIDEGSVFLPCTVYCVVSNEDNIFAEQTGSGGNWGTDPCGHVVQPGGSVTGDYYFTTYNNRPYFIWHSQAAGGGNVSRILPILATKLTEGIDYNSSGRHLINGHSAGDVWHAGPADGDCEEEFWELRGFSF